MLSSGLLHLSWVLSAVRRGKQRQFVCWIQVKAADGKVQISKSLVDNGSEVNLVRKGLLQEDEAKVSSTPVQLEGVSGHRLERGDREADFAVRLVKQSVCITEEVKKEWLSGKFYDAPARLVCSWVNRCFTLIVCCPWDTGQASSKIRQTATRPSCIICTHAPRVFHTSRSQISFKFEKMGRRLQDIKRNLTKETWNH